MEGVGLAWFKIYLMYPDMPTLWFFAEILPQIPIYFEHPPDSQIFREIVNILAFKFRKYNIS